MRQVLVDRTEIAVSRLAFGTASLHHLLLATSRARILAEALALGITHFDTSPYYGFGIAEESLGRALGGSAGATTIATKVGLYPPAGARAKARSVWFRKGASRLRPALNKPIVDWSVAAARRSLDTSLARLARDHVDFLFLHEPDSGLVGTEGVLRWLERERSAGRVRAWGVAGPFDRFEPWIASESPLVQVVQSLDDREGRLRACLARVPRPLQFTYGYFSRRSSSESLSAADIVSDAFRRNTTGTVLISSRNVARLRETVLASGA